MAPALLCAAGVVLPLAYLVIRAFDAEPGELGPLLLRRHNAVLLGQTLLLTVSVLVTTTLLAVPAAWLTTRTDLPGRGLATLVLTLPLAVPGYLMAYALLAIGGEYGAAARLTGWPAPRLSGYWGALVALSLYNFPYLLLTLRAGLRDMDPALEEAARALGDRPGRVFFRVVLPQLRPALLAGWLLVALHVITDFGVVSLMNYQTFSYALYLQYRVYDTVYAAWIALMLLGLAGVVVALELWLLRGLRLHRAGSGVGRRGQIVPLGPWAWLALGFVGLLVTAGVVLPVSTIGYWATRADLAALRSDLVVSVIDSLAASAPAAVLATALAMPVAYMARRYPSRRTVVAERLAYLGYATPALAFALGLLVFTLKLPAVSWGPIDLPAGWGLYQSLTILIYAYSLHFMAEAVGPIRASLFQANPRLEEASRSLGLGPVRTFFRVTLPLMRPGITVALALVFLSAMKELPLTFLLSPTKLELPLNLDERWVLLRDASGFQTLATNIWGYTSEAMYAEAAPFALLILLVSGLFVGVLLAGDRRVA